MIERREREKEREKGRRRDIEREGEIRERESERERHRALRSAQGLRSCRKSLGKLPNGEIKRKERLIITR